MTSTMFKHATGTGETAVRMTVLAGTLIVPTASAWIQKKSQIANTPHGGVTAIVKISPMFNNVNGMEEIAAIMTGMPEN